jgi:hypothetical protein
MNSNNFETIKENIFSFKDFIGNQKTIDYQTIKPIYLEMGHVILKEYIDDHFMIMDILVFDYKENNVYVFDAFNITKNSKIKFVLMEYQYKKFLESCEKNKD